MTERAGVAIVGGAAMGSAVAFFLLDELGFQGRVVVPGRDRGYAHAATARSTSGYRQQFSTAVNVALSHWSSPFLADANDRLAIGGRAPGIPISTAGYLYLGDAGALAGFEANHATQRALGVDVALLNPRRAARALFMAELRRPAVGSLGLSGEGWFDGYLLMRALADVRPRARRRRSAGGSGRDRTRRRWLWPHVR